MYCEVDIPRLSLGDVLLDKQQLTNINPFNINLSKICDQKGTMPVP
jgi:hypothetical protein